MRSQATGDDFAWPTNVQMEKLYKFVRKYPGCLDRNEIEFIYEGYPVGVNLCYFPFENSKERHCVVCRGNSAFLVFGMKKS